MSFTSDKPDTARRSRLFSVSSSFNRFTWSPFRPPYSLRHQLPSLRSFGPHPQLAGLVPSAHQPAEASQQSLQPYASSFPSSRPPPSKTYIGEDHFKGGRSVRAMLAARVFFLAG